MDKEKLILTLLEKLLWIDGVEKGTDKKEDNILWSEFIWKYVILRGYDSWVHFGKLVSAKPWIYRLAESRRIYRWRVKDKKWISLSELSLYWLDNEYTKICTTLNLIEITDSRISEIIPCSDEAIENIKTFAIYNP
jgi:hypothetical protein